MKKQSKKQPTKPKNTHYVTVAIRPPQKRLWDQLENKSAFIQLCLDNAVGIMAWDILRKGGYPEPKRPPKAKVVRTYNLLNPLPDYKTRFANLKELPRENSPTKPVNW